MKNAMFSVWRGHNSVRQWLAVRSVDADVYGCNVTPQATLLLSTCHFEGSYGVYLEFFAGRVCSAALPTLGVLACARMRTRSCVFVCVSAYTTN